MSNPSSQHTDLRASEERIRLLVQSVRDYGIFMLDPQGRVQTWNPGAQRFYGYRDEEIIGQHFSRFYPPEALARELPERGLKVATELGCFEDEGWRVRRDGSRFWANVVITALRDPGTGQLVGFAKVTRDLTNRRMHEEALRQSEERFRLLVEGVRDYAIFMLDANGHVASWNLGAQRIKGYAAEEIIGHHFSVFYPPEAIEAGWPEHELAVATKAGSFVDEGWRIRKNGSRFWANVAITALRDEDGRLRGFAKLTRDLTEFKRPQTGELQGKQRDTLLDAERSARMAAQRTSRIKDEFLATLSHELRTPLSSILGWTQILLKSQSTLSPQVMQAMEVIDRNARAQVQLITDLLDLNRIMTGKIRLDLQQARVADIVREAVESAKPAAAAKDIQLLSMPDPCPPIIMGDPSRLQQVVWNLLTNAIKFTPKEGKVEVLLRRVNSHIELSVSDTGIGIPAGHLTHVFDRFSQNDGSTARVYGGLGLGLAISKQLVELHGGTIRAASQGEGKGATFFVNLPLSIVQLDNERLERTHPTTQASSSEHLDLPSLKDVRVLVVDDEPDARDLLRQVFEEHGAVVDAFDSGDAALAELRRSKPDVIVSDIGMPGTDGYQFMRALRAAEARDDRVPAIALTAFARADDRKRTLLAGYQAHLAKPFDVAELLLLVADVVRR